MKGQLRVVNREKDMDQGRGSMYNRSKALGVTWIDIVASCHGLLFGFDNGITGGVISMTDFQERFFPEVRCFNHVHVLNQIPVCLWFLTWYVVVYHW